MVLYRGNTFQFRGFHSLLAFAPTLSPVQWNVIRRVHISTLFSEHSFWYPSHDHFLLPDNYYRCQLGCEMLSNLPKLDYFRLEVTFRNDKDDGISINPVQLKALISLLNEVEAGAFELILEEMPPGELREALNLSKFSIIHRKETYNSEVYSWNQHFMVPDFVRMRKFVHWSI